MSNSTYKSNRGFTIVELLIVIVVIAILATISIMAYNGVQARTNNTAAATSAENVAKKIELYNAANSSYPTANISSGDGITTQLATVKEASLTGAGITLNGTTPTGTARTSTVYVRLCGATAPTHGTVPTGFEVYRYDFDTNAWKTTPDQKGGTTTACATVLQG